MDVAELKQKLIIGPKSQFFNGGCKHFMRSTFSAMVRVKKNMFPYFIYPFFSQNEVIIDLYITIHKYI